MCLQRSLRRRDSKTVTRDSGRNPSTIPRFTHFLRLSILADVTDSENSAESSQGVEVNSKLSLVRGGPFIARKKRFVFSMRITGILGEG
jgi:hypothetical protein